MCQLSPQPQGKATGLSLLEQIRKLEYTAFQNSNKPHTRRRESGNKLLRDTSTWGQHCGAVHLAVAYGAAS